MNKKFIQFRAIHIGRVIDSQQTFVKTCISGSMTPKATKSVENFIKSIAFFL